MLKNMIKIKLIIFFKFVNFSFSANKFIILNIIKIIIYNLVNTIFNLCFNLIFNRKFIKLKI